jgi:hypothetical protein
MKLIGDKILSKASRYLRKQGMNEVMNKIKYLVEDMKIQVDEYTKFWDENSGKSVVMSRNSSVTTAREDISHECAVDDAIPYIA